MKSLISIVSLLAFLQQAPVQRPGQPPAQPAQPGGQKLVLNVNDPAGRFIMNLKPENLVIEEDGVEKKITSFIADSDTPVSLGILIDKSTSMRLPLYVQGRERVPAAIIAATGVARAVIKLMKPQDEFILMTFDQKLQVKQNFTQDKKKLDDQLTKMNVVGEATHLYDNILDAMDKMKKAKYRRRALIVITDAYDTSGKQLEDLRPKIAEQEIQIFTCGLRSVYEEIPDPTAEPLFQMVLKSLSADTGGISMIIDVPEIQSDMAAMGVIGFAAVLTMELRGQYTLTYDTDKTTPLSSRFVRVRAPEHPNLRIRIRRDAEEPLARKK